MTRHARGYVRLSQTSERSIEAQKEDIRSYTNDHDDLQLEHIYDEGQKASGWDDSREQYQQMLEDARSNEFDALVVRDASRLGRNAKERMRQFLNLDAWGVEFHTQTRGYVDPSAPEDFLMEAFKSLSDDEGKGAEVDRLVEAIDDKVEAGHYHGCPPKGLTYTDDKLGLKPDPSNLEAFETALEILELSDSPENYSLSDIAEETGASKSRVWRVTNNQRDRFEDAAVEQVVSDD